MFLGYYEIDGEGYNYIYYKNSKGYKAFCEDIFKSYYECIDYLDLKITGKTYKEKQDCLYDLAVYYQSHFAMKPWSWGELATITDFFYKNGKRYGMYKELHENGIC